MWKTTGGRLPESTIIRRAKSGIELLFKMDDGYDVQSIG